MGQTPIVTLKDTRLVRIDPTKKDFYRSVLTCDCNETGMYREPRFFVEHAFELTKLEVAPYYRPIMDPSLDDDGNLIYELGRKPATENYYENWRELIKKMPAVSGKKWHLGTRKQYFAFLVWLVNNLIKEGWDVKDAVKAVSKDSSQLGVYNDDDPKYRPYLRNTGSKGACGIYDLANTYKILSVDQEDGYWLAGGTYYVSSLEHPLADMMPYKEIGKGIFGNWDYFGVPWLVIE